MTTSNAKVEPVTLSRVGVWGHYHGGNIGDDIVVATLIHHIRLRSPGCEIYGFSANPADTADRHKIPSYSILSGPLHTPSRQSNSDPESSSFSDDVDSSAGSHAVQAGQLRTSFVSRISVVVQHIPIARNLWGSLRRIRDDLRMLRVARGFDAIVVAGSGPVFDDMWGVWAHPFNLLRWSVICRLAGTRFYLLNVGAGPVHRKLSRRFLKWALNMATYRSFRDDSSVRLVETLGVRGPNDRVCDSAFAVPHTVLEDAVQQAVKSKRPLVGISPMAYMDPRYWPDALPGLYEHYLKALADLGIWLLDAGYDLIMLKSQRMADARAANDLIVTLRKAISNYPEERVLDLETSGHLDLLRQMAGCEYIVGGRFHCHILPFCLGKPVLSVSYHQKTDELMQNMGLDEFCYPMQTVVGEELIRGFELLRDNHAMVRDRIHTATQTNLVLLQEQFDRLFPIR